MAEELGLSFESSAVPSEIGELTGTYRGRRVAINPDGVLALTAWLPYGQEDLLLDTWPERFRPAEGQEPFDTGTAFDRLFATRYAKPNVAARVQQQREFLVGAVERAKSWRRKEQLVARGYTVITGITRGNFAGTHVGAAEARAHLEDACWFAEQVQGLVG